MFSDVLPTDDEEDEDDMEAHEASLQRLKVRLFALYIYDVDPPSCVPTRKRTTRLVK